MISSSFNDGIPIETAEADDLQVFSVGNAVIQDHRSVEIFGLLFFKHYVYNLGEHHSERSELPTDKFAQRTDHGVLVDHSSGGQCFLGFSTSQYCKLSPKHTLKTVLEKIAENIKK